MNRERAEEMLTDMLAGELSSQELDQLFEYKNEHPDFAEYCRVVESAWGLSESDESSVTYNIDLPESVQNEIAKGTGKCGKIIPLDLNVLDNLAAAGDNSLNINNEKNRH